MNFGVLGVNHKNTPIEVREKLAFSEQKLKELVIKLKDMIGISDLLILSTCNRTEVYFSAQDPINTASELQKFLLSNSKLEAQSIHFYKYFDEQALRHLLELVSGLDSLVLGETQILGQVKQAFQNVSKISKFSAEFIRIFDFAYQVAKKVRSETGLTSKSVSIGSIAIDLANSVFGSLEKKSVLIIGTGEVAELTLKHLKGSGAKIFVTNRTQDKALQIASKYRASVLPFNDLKANICDLDIVISSVSSQRPLLKIKALKEIMHSRKYKPLFLLDLGMPRNIEATNAASDNLHLYNIDDLQHISNDNQQIKAKELTLAHEIIEIQLDEYKKLSRDFEQRHVISDFRARFEQVYFADIKKTIVNMGLATEDEKLLRQSLHKISQKMLHQLTIFIKQNSENPLITQQVMQTLGISDDMIAVKQNAKNSNSKTNDKIIEFDKGYKNAAF